MNVGVIGTGYVGLVAGSCFAESGNDVVCVDNNAEKIANLQKGIIPIYEPGLPEIIERNVREERLVFTTDLESAVKKSFVIFIAVGTPPAENGAADLSAVFDVARAIGRTMDRYKVIVTKSTVPVGTTEQIRNIIRKETNQPFDVLANPEFLKQGAAVEDFMKPDRIVVGADDVRPAEILRDLYAPFVRTGSPVMIMDIRTAEMLKYAANAFLAARISFMNEIANLCEEVGANVDMIRKGLASDSRVGPAFLFPGVGYGGSCFPKDTQALIQTGREHNYTMRILEAVHEVNWQQAARFVEKVRKHFGGNIAGKRFGVWGLSFKPRTNDMRDAPSIKVIENLLADGASIAAYDPEATEEAKRIFGSRIQLASSNYGCLEGADALLVVTEWQAFRNPNFERMKSIMRQAVIFDGRNIYDPAHLTQFGFTYYSIGRPSGVA
ncbi:MAG: UDP-glucose/GDP-mannose dehydrogenase family protein [Acidobacteria bacterium]|nr:UDP-glucose/GDP-mannose dehydrogenase family protein [Acidobacteriota bacterium]